MQRHSRPIKYSKRFKDFSKEWEEAEEVIILQGSSVTKILKNWYHKGNFPAIRCQSEGVKFYDIPDMESDVDQISKCGFCLQWVILEGVLCEVQGEPLSKQFIIISCCANDSEIVCYSQHYHRFFKNLKKKKNQKKESLNPMTCFLVNLVYLFLAVAITFL